MKKVSLELVQEVMVDLDVNPDTRTSIMRAIQRAAERLAEDAEKEPKAKQQFVIVVPRGEPTVLPPDREGGLPTAYSGEPLEIGWVVQIPESDSPAVSADRIIKAAYAHNETKKGRRMPVKTFGEACEVVPAKLLKEAGVAVKTRMPVQVVTICNELPKEAV